MQPRHWLKMKAKEIPTLSVPKEDTQKQGKTSMLFGLIRFLILQLNKLSSNYDPCAFSRLKILLIRFPRGLFIRMMLVLDKIKKPVSVSGT